MIKKLTSVIIILIFTSLCISACSENDEKLFRRFNFSLNFGYGLSVNCVDTYNDTFTKDLIRGTETIKFIIPEDKMREIYETFLEYEIYDLPENISGGACIEPTYAYIFTYTYGKSKKTITCSDVDTSGYFSGKATSENFVSFAHMIRDYIYDTEEYKNMSPVNGYYL